MLLINYILKFIHAGRPLYSISSWEETNWCTTISQLWLLKGNAVAVHWWSWFVIVYAILVLCDIFLWPTGMEHSILLVCCGCEPLGVTLVRAQLWPASPAHPRYAFSFSLLDWAESLLLECQVALKDFCQALSFRCPYRTTEVSFHIVTTTSASIGHSFTEKRDLLNTNRFLRGVQVATCGCHFLYISNYMFCNLGSSSMTWGTSHSYPKVWIQETSAQHVPRWSRYLTILYFRQL